MSYPRPPPSPHQLPDSDVLLDVTQGNSESCEETMNDEIYNQLYYLRTTGATPLEALHSTTFEATHSSVNRTTNIYDTGAPHDSYAAYYAAYSQNPSTSQLHSQSQSRLDPQPQVFHSVPWNFQDVSNEFTSLAMSSYDVFQQSQQDYFQHEYAPREETIIPDGGMFPIDIPLNSNSMDVHQQLSDSELAVDSPLSTLHQGVQPLHTHTEPTGGATLVPPPVRYDDEDIPRNDPSWLLKPRKHPWVQSGRAYLCPYDACQITIIQKRNKRRHNAVVHGVD